MSGCTVERRFLVRRSTLDLASGASSAPDAGTWTTAPCDVPLFTDRERAAGCCRSCLEGWSVPENAPTTAGLATVRAALIPATATASRKRRR